MWWNKAFEAAGFRNAVQVKDPTPDMDPMDIRYAWILWINRDERGFSSGGTFRDPRTGEILGSKTRMDSHRIRTIGNYWESYTPTTGGDDALFMADTDLLEALAQPAAAGLPAAQRDLVLLRQSLLTAHELGHVMGFQHNFSSSLDNFASVMEYPTPRVKVTAGKLDLSDAFQRAIGPYDEMTARYAYADFPAGKEREGLEAVIREMRAKGLHYVPESDPRWTWYDDRATPAEYLRETMAARAIMLASYGPNVLKPGEPIGALRDMRLWMTYLHHRWAIESGLRYVGGMYHEYVVKGDTVPPTTIVPAATQREVLGLLMSALNPAAMELPERLLAQLPPHPNGNLEDIAGDYAFDHLRAARILSAMVLADLLEPARTARLVAFADRQSDALTLPEVMQAVLRATWSGAAPGHAHAAILAAGDRAGSAGRDDDPGRTRRRHPRRPGGRAAGGRAAGPVVERAQGRRPGDRGASAPGRARHHPLPAEPGRERPEGRRPWLGRTAALALSAEPGAASRRRELIRAHRSRRSVVDLQALPLQVETLPRQPEPAGGELDVAGGPQRVLDERPLDVLDRGAQRLVAADHEFGWLQRPLRCRHRTASGSDLRRQVFGHDDRARLGQRHHAAHLVGELAYVAGPGVEQQEFRGRFRDPHSGLAGFLEAALEEVIEQQRDLLAPFAQRRNRQPDDVEPVNGPAHPQLPSHSLDFRRMRTGGK